MPRRRTWSLSRKAHEGLERVYLFFAVQGAVTFYAVVWGGAPERIAGSALALAAVATLLLQGEFATRFVEPELGVLGVDIFLFAGLLTLAAFADRFWTFWLAALQGLGSAAHLVRTVDVEMIPVAYAILIAVWSYPMILLVLLGTSRHRRRLRKRGHDRDWS